MQYLSPAALLGDTLPIDKKAIILGRKKLLAEWELNAGNDLEIRGRSYGRNDIIAYFEDLQKEYVLEYHNTIREDKILLQFLEEAQLPSGSRFNANPLYTDEAFIRWLSPYFYTSCTRFVDSCFEKINDQGLMTLLDNPLLLIPWDKEGIWIGVAKIIRDNIDLLTRYQNQGKNRWRNPHIPAIIKKLMDRRYVSMIESIPESRFSELRNRYAYAMMQVSIYVFNSNIAKRGLTETWIGYAKTLAVSPALQEQIADKLQEFKRIRKKSRIPRIIIISIIALVFISDLFDKNNKLDPSQLIYFHSDTLVNKKDSTRDSLLRHLPAHQYRS